MHKGAASGVDLVGTVPESATCLPDIKPPPSVLGKRAKDRRKLTIYAEFLPAYAPELNPLE